MSSWKRTPPTVARGCPSGPGSNAPSVKIKNGMQSHQHEEFLEGPNFWRARASTLPQEQYSASLTSGDISIFSLEVCPIARRSDMAIFPRRPESCISTNCILPSKEGICEGIAKPSVKSLSMASVISTFLDSLLSTKIWPALHLDKSTATPRVSAFFSNGKS